MSTHNSGFAFVTVLIMMMILFTLSGAYVAVVQSEMRLATNYSDSAKAFYAAEAGKELTLWQMRFSTQNFWGWTTSLPTRWLYGAFFPGTTLEVAIEPVPRKTDTIRIRSIGRAKTPTGPGISKEAMRVVEADVVTQFPFGYALMTGPDGNVDVSRGRAIADGDILAGGEIVGQFEEVYRPVSTADRVSDIRVPKPDLRDLQSRARSLYTNTVQWYMQRPIRAEDLVYQGWSSNPFVPNSNYQSAGVQALASRWQSDLGIYFLKGNTRVPALKRALRGALIVEGDLVIDAPRGVGSGEVNLDTTWLRSEDEGDIMAAMLSFTLPPNYYPGLVVTGDVTVTPRSTFRVAFPAYVGGKVRVSQDATAVFLGGLIAGKGLELDDRALVRLETCCRDIAGGFESPASFRYEVEQPALPQNQDNYPVKLHVVEWRGYATQP